jgi:hypothetical protein
MALPASDSEMAAAMVRSRNVIFIVSRPYRKSENCPRGRRRIEHYPAVRAAVCAGLCQRTRSDWMRHARPIQPEIAAIARKPPEI